MAVRVRFFASVREAAGKPEENLSGVVSLASLLEELVSRFGERMEAELYQPGKKELRPTINILLNGKALKLPDDLGIRIDDGDELAIFPPVAGG
ncbi:MAG: ubiquitin-like small modifier protein 1 [Candidatus Hadarchaeales archaeon]